MNIQMNCHNCGMPWPYSSINCAWSGCDRVIRMDDNKSEKVIDLTVGETAIEVTPPSANITPEQLPELKLFDLAQHGTPRLEVLGDGTYRINGEVETKPEVIVAALSQISTAWAKTAKIREGTNLSSYTILHLQPAPENAKG